MRYGMFREDVLQPDRNPAMTDVDNDTALNPLGAMQKSVKQGLGPDATPSQLQVIKQAFGNRVNWRKNVSVCEGIVTDFNQAVLQNQIACRETGGVFTRAVLAGAWARSVWPLGEP
jgi:hypothetical protein